MGDELIEANARFVEPGVLEAGEHRVFADRVIIATGSRPQIPPKWVEFGDRILTTDTLFDQESLPATMAVVGLGVIGLELGQALHRLGVEVTGVEMTETLGGVDDPSVREVAAEIFGKELELWLGRAAELSETENGQLSVSAGERSTVVDKVLVSAGRTPNVETLGLEQLGVAFDERGAPVHDRNTMQIGDLPVYLAGDVTGERPVLHEAGDEGRIAGYNAAADSVTGFRRKVPLSINFADPNVCTVGMRWSELDRDSTAVGEIRFAPVGRALIMGKNKGILRIYAEKANGRLLGAEMVAPKGENLAHLLAWSIQQGLGVIDLLRMPFYHPVIEEALQAALYDCYAKLDKRVRQVPVELIPL
jgi:dihydrolipoamide dehydrogenase